MKKLLLLLSLLIIPTQSFAQTIVSGYVEKSSTGTLTSLGTSLSGTLAAMPVAGIVGRLYYPTDGVYVYRDNGSSWDAYIGNSKLTPLSSTAGWSWDNQGTATISTAIGTTVLGAPIGIGDGLHVRYKTAPATPFTITVGYEAGNAKGLGTANLVLGCRENATGKLKLIQIGYSSSSIAAIIQHFTNATTWSSNRAGTPVINWSSSLSYQWLRFTDNGTDNIYSVSRDGRTWAVIGTETRTTGFTCDQIQFGIQAEAVSDDWEQAITIVHYLES